MVLCCKLSRLSEAFVHGIDVMYLTEFFAGFQLM